MSFKNRQVDGKRVSLVCVIYVNWAGGEVFVLLQCTASHQRPNPGLAVGDFIACGLVRCVTTLAVGSPQMDLDYLKYNPGVRPLPI